MRFPALAQLVAVSSAVLACGSPTTPTTPTPSAGSVTAEASASTAPTATATAAAPASTPKLALEQGWGVIATAPVTKTFSVLPSTDGTALVAIHSATDPKAPAEWARVTDKTIDLAPALAIGMPAFGFGDRAAGARNNPQFDARSKENAVLSLTTNTEKGDVCEVYSWSDDAWTEIGRTVPREGPCVSIRAWAKGAAAGIVDGPDGTQLKVFGKLPGPAPVVGKVGPAPCDLSLHDVLAWETGELVVRGVNCEPKVYVQAWAPRATRPTSTMVEIDYNAPIFWSFLPGGEFGLEGGGILPEKPNEETSVRLTMKFDGKAFSKVSLRASANVGELMMMGPPSVRALATPDDSVEVEGYARASDTLFVTVRVKSGDALLLRSVPVDTPLTMK